MRKRYSDGVRLSATFLAKQAGVDAAAQSFGIDRRTVRGWLRDTELPDDQWSAIEATLLARGAEMAARGDTRGLAATLTGAGIASRNTRYATLIARREARRAGEQDAGDTIEARRQAIIAKLEPWQPETPESHRRNRYLYECRTRLMAFIDRQDDPATADVWDDVPDPAPEHEAGMRYLVTVSQPGAPPDLSDAEFEASFVALLADVQAAADAWWPGHCAELQARAYIERDANGRIRIRPDGERITIELPPGSPLPPEYEGATVFAVQVPSAAQDVSPRPQLPYQPPEPVQEGPRPDDHDHPSWRRLE